MWEGGGGGLARGLLHLLLSDREGLVSRASPHTWLFVGRPQRGRRDRQSAGLGHKETDTLR